jgi:hypothetical protein
MTLKRICDSVVIGIDPKTNEVKLRDNIEMLKGDYLMVHGDEPVGPLKVGSRVTVVRFE